MGGGFAEPELTRKPLRMEVSKPIGTDMAEMVNKVNQDLDKACKKLDSVVPKNVQNVVVYTPGLKLELQVNTYFDQDTLVVNQRNLGDLKLNYDLGVQHFARDRDGNFKPADHRFLIRGGR